MSINTANIDIIRDNGKLSSISVVMPFWDKTLEDESLLIDIPMFTIQTSATDDLDALIATREAITAFCLSAERFGKGLETELRSIGWIFTEQKEDFSSLSFNIPSQNFVVDRMIQTGEQFADKLEIAC